MFTHYGRRFPHVTQPWAFFWSLSRAATCLIVFWYSSINNSERSGRCFAPVVCSISLSVQQKLCFGWPLPLDSLLYDVFCRVVGSLFCQRLRLDGFPYLNNWNDCELHAQVERRMAANQRKRQLNRLRHTRLCLCNLFLDYGLLKTHWNQSFLLYIYCTFPSGIPSCSSSVAFPDSKQT